MMMNEWLSSFSFPEPSSYGAPYYFESPDWFFMVV